MLLVKKIEKLKQCGGEVINGPCTLMKVEGWHKVQSRWNNLNVDGGVNIEEQQEDRGESVSF